MIVGAFDFFIERGEPGSEDALIEALNKYGGNDGGLDMALYFLDSGNPKLEDAALKWGTNHNYPIGQPGSSGLHGNLQWGKRYPPNHLPDEAGVSALNPHPATCRILTRRVVQV